MVLLIVVLAAGAYFGQRWRVDSHRAYRAWLRDNNSAAATTRRAPRS